MLTWCAWTKSTPTTPSKRSCSRLEHSERPLWFGCTAPRAFTYHNADGDPRRNPWRSWDPSGRPDKPPWGQQRLRSCGGPRGRGSRNGPRESYDDASVDFRPRKRRCLPAYRPGNRGHPRTATGRTYAAISRFSTTLIIDHGNLVGDGTINAAHMDSGSAALGDLPTSRRAMARLCVCAPDRRRRRRRGCGSNKIVSQIVTGTAPTSVNRADSGLAGLITPSSATKKGAHSNCGRGTFHRRGHCRRLRLGSAKRRCRHLGPGWTAGAELCWPYKPDVPGQPSV